MSDVDALIARASALAGKCGDKEVRQLLKILHVILSLVEAGLSGWWPGGTGGSTSCVRELNPHRRFMGGKNAPLYNVEATERLA
ncbi:hypothetical protein DIPPA_14448 [Diplonema papillatum]|nr:hypothetical protein DIPPA_14448 [Diplonema papillatum]